MREKGKRNIMKKSHKISMAVVSFAMMTALCACSANVNVTEAKSGEEASNVEESKELTGIAEEEKTGMANPMVDVLNDSDFSDKLGIPIDTSFFTGDNLKRFIIGDKLADVRFDVVNVNAETVECMLRATKDDEDNKNPYELIAGVYASDFSDEVTLSYTSDEGDIDMISVDSQSENCYITRWDFNDTHYVFSVFGVTSQMQLATLYDQIMLAIGADHMENSAVEPLTSEIDVTDISGGTFAANIENVETDENGTIADFTVYSMDLYDAAEVNALAEGDQIKIRTSSDDEFETIVIETIEHKTVTYSQHEEALGAESAGDKDVVVINGGLDEIGEGGVELIESEGETYRYFGMDDYGTYKKQGTVNLQIAEDAEIIDHSEDWNSTEEVPSGKTIKATDFMQFAADDTLGFTYSNTKVEVVNGQVTKITRRYTP